MTELRENVLSRSHQATKPATLREIRVEQGLGINALQAAICEDSQILPVPLLATVLLPAGDLAPDRTASTLPV